MIRSEWLLIFQYIFIFFYLYSSQGGFEISPFNHLFLREDLGEFIKEKNLKTTFTIV